jgi:hypothetical protein
MPRWEQIKEGCEVEGCDRPHNSLGYCKSHAARVRRYGEPGPATFRPAKRVDDEVNDPALQCAVDDCARRIWARGYCPTHYRRWSRHGDINHIVQPKWVPPKQCSKPECDEKVFARGKCQQHYLRDYDAQRPPRPEQQRKTGRRYILRQYGMTVEDYDAMVAEQGDRCAICRGEHMGHNGHPNYSWSVDHDHVTGKVRGLLCRNCNVGLGFFKDELELVESALDYLRKHAA